VTAPEGPPPPPPPPLCTRCVRPLDPVLARLEPDRDDHPTCDPTHRRPPIAIKERYVLPINWTNPWRMDSDRRRW
jgi:hypothetical protein